MNDKLVKEKKEMIISCDLDGATEAEKHEALTRLFTGLTSAIRDYGCTVDLSDPENIKVSN